MIIRTIKDRLKDEYWEKYARNSRMKYSKPIALRKYKSRDDIRNGRVKRICIKCLKNEINPRMRKNIKTCKECYEKNIILTEEYDETK